jgi:hypothetical protein
MLREKCFELGLDRISVYYAGLSFVGKARGCNTDRAVEATLLLHKGIWLSLPPGVLRRHYKIELVHGGGIKQFLIWRVHVTYDIVFGCIIS